MTSSMVKSLVVRMQASCGIVFSIAPARRAGRFAEE
jgi:hypothetical protein